MAKYPEERFLNAQLTQCARLLESGAELPDAAGREALVSCLRACFEAGVQTDDLRAVHDMVQNHAKKGLACRRAAGGGGGKDPEPEGEDVSPLLFPAVILAAEGFQLGHAGSLHAHAVGAIAASVCKLPYVSVLGGRARSPRLTLREELYHGASGLLLHVLDRDGLQFFASAPGADGAVAYLRLRLGDAAPEDVPALCSLCAGACLLSAFHQYAAGRMTP